MSETIFIVSETKKKTDIEKTFSETEYRFVNIVADALPTVLQNETPGLIIFYAEKAELQRIYKILEVVKSYDDNLSCIIISNFKNIEDVVGIMKNGAYDYFALPLDRARLKKSAANAIRLYTLTKKVFLLESQIGLKQGFDEIIGTSSKMLEVFNVIKTVAKSNATILILGESGTGKELVAKALHKHSPRAKNTFMDINCGAIPGELLENEMFGHERGAYTGADKKYIGSFEKAHQGTIFLDEISEMSPNLQVKLLRFLQERSFTRVGGNELIDVDVRIVAATNRDLGKAVSKGEFREDLFYRLNVVPILLPSLRERKEDIPLLVKYFLEKISAKNEKIFIDFSEEAIEALIAYDWPGNVRELENAVERIVVLHNDTKVKLSYLPAVIQESLGKNKNKVIEYRHIDQKNIMPLEIVERYAIESALRQCLGNVSEASSKLKIGQATLYRKIKQYGLRV